MDNILKGYEFAYYPSNSQKKMLAQYFGASRWIYNHYLNRIMEKYNAWKQLPEENRGTAPFMNYVAMAKDFTQLKKDTSLAWLHDINVSVVQETLKTLEKAYLNFFSMRAGYPRFKAKFARQAISATIRGFSVRDGQVYMARKRLRLRGGRNIEGTPMRITVTKETTGKYYVKVICAVVRPEKTLKTETVGIDMGIKDFAVDSNGNSYNLPASITIVQQKLKLAQTKFNKVLEQLKLVKTDEEKTLLNTLRQKRKTVVAKLHARIKNIRKDFVHKLSRVFVDTHAVVTIESLQITEMVKECKASRTKKHNLPRLIMSSSWFEFFRQLEYKAAWSGTTMIVRAGEYFPSTQIHNSCGIKSETQVPLKNRQWYCGSCKEWVDRDKNAASNLNSLGQFMLKVRRNALTPVIKFNATTAVWL